MPKITNMIETASDYAADFIEKTATPASRAGHTIERAGRMLEEEVSPAVIALQMTENSPTHQTYTVADVQSYGKAYQDSKIKVVLTAKQTRALINDQKENTLDCGDAIPQN